VIETTDIMLQMVACGRGVAALPGWLVAEYQKKKLRVAPGRLGRNGVPKQIFLGVRSADQEIEYIAAFIRLARATQRTGSRRTSSTLKTAKTDPRA
jgi:LysR family transcriptional regulator for metE and metH